MYIGDVHDGTGLHHIVDAIVTLCLDEHLEGRCQRADVTLRADGSVVVRPDGRQVGAFDGS